MSTHIDQGPSFGKVLTHPAFDRPAVKNHVGPGRHPKGIVSIRRRRLQRSERLRLAAIAQGEAPQVNNQADRDNATQHCSVAVPGIESGAKSNAAAPHALAKHERMVIEAAFEILAAHMRGEDGAAMVSPAVVMDLIRLRLAGLDHEVFAVLFLDAQHRLIAFEEMFRGTLTQTAVYPREVVKRALEHGAAAVILAHNHPSGVPSPSNADRLLTDALRKALELVDVRTLDHIIVGGGLKP